MNELIISNEEPLLYGFVKEMKPYSNHPLLVRGWGNGYVAVPPSHELHGKYYNEIYMDIDIHGGITFSHKASEINQIWEEAKNIPSDYWVFGFGTAHPYDNETNCSKEYVEDQVKHLMAQLVKFN